MSRALVLSDEQYEIIKGVADVEGRTPEDLFLAWTMAEETRYRLAHPTYYETDEWMRHLGMSDAEIQEIEAEIAQEEASGVAIDANS
ncbi:MAG TPA: hypothetical protein VMV29_12250 [Ktedonobacterales bacterium]|nr:hypothetical protein [Ktedonobacterales bacterium]